MASKDTQDFVEYASCKEQTEEVANKIINFAGSVPTEVEVLARCRMVFEYMLHHAMKSIGSDLDAYEVEVQSEEK